MASLVIAKRFKAWHVSTALAAKRTLTGKWKTWLIHPIVYGEGNATIILATRM